MKTPGWLGHLPTDSRGRPVPYINRWGPVSNQQLSIRHDPLVDRAAVFDEDSEETEPDLVNRSYQRQRECMIRGICQVCGKPVPWPHRYLVISSVSLTSAKVSGDRATVEVIEPWLHLDCALLAVRVCPVLIRRRSAEDLRLVAITHPAQVRLTISVGTLNGHLAEQSRLEQPAIWVMAVLSGLNVERPSAPPVDVSEQVGA